MYWSVSAVESEGMAALLLVSLESGLPLVLLFTRRLTHLLRMNAIKQRLDGEGIDAWSSLRVQLLAAVSCAVTYLRRFSMDASVETP